jgi:hypothetical protein
MDFMQFQNGNISERNKMLWSPACNHRFKVKSYYNILQPGEPFLFPWMRVWKVKAPSRIAFFTWTTTMGKIFMIDNLRTRALTRVNWCCLCKISGYLIIIHCEFTCEIWYLYE